MPENDWQRDQLVRNGQHAVELIRRRGSQYLPYFTEVKEALKSGIRPDELNLTPEQAADLERRYANSIINKRPG